uniref:RING-type domain-containing protein n=1 Tax=Chromera velia CCMP2878 TaxID=1169474 RepID=A0A0G4H432_9ALVE|eukprot:Cvel_24625.t1-p1 / transcript=Cvel_24625.t1 / gene=Cvel_24625 / organism=Chromera_velia_CCMP2878 / gene_product=E3 ubiquitin-protein ligase ATL15, putative / transcript_product=E3 ubiquitin-protein ligase ATL15, putative / location=Cvel_scaffold2686:7447-15041(-) / protein_length=1276 / sequence_SO=supercontig / SO=protein_coding / is_pseudo=false
MGSYSVSRACEVAGSAFHGVALFFIGDEDIEGMQFILWFLDMGPVMASMALTLCMSCYVALSFPLSWMVFAHLTDGTENLALWPITLRVWVWVQCCLQFLVLPNFLFQSLRLLRVLCSAPVREVLREGVYCWENFGWRRGGRRQHTDGHVQEGEGRAEQEQELRGRGGEMDVKRAEAGRVLRDEVRRLTGSLSFQCGWWASAVAFFLCYLPLDATWNLSYRATLPPGVSPGSYPSFCPSFWPEVWPLWSPWLGRRLADVRYAVGIPHPLTLSAVARFQTNALTAGPVLLLLICLFLMPSLLLELWQALVLSSRVLLRRAAKFFRGEDRDGNNDPIMEIVQQYPLDAVTFIKHVMAFGAFSPFVLSVPCLLYLWAYWREAASCAYPLRMWVLLNCVLQMLQVPVRTHFFLCLRALQKEPAYRRVEANRRRVWVAEALGGPAAAAAVLAQGERGNEQGRNNAEFLRVRNRILRCCRMLTSSEAWWCSKVCSIFNYAWFIIGVVWAMNCGACPEAPSLWGITVAVISSSMVKLLITLVCFYLVFPARAVQEGQAHRHPPRPRGAAPATIERLPLLEPRFCSDGFGVSESEEEEEEEEEDEEDQVNSEDLTLAEGFEKKHASALSPGRTTELSIQRERRQDKQGGGNAVLPLSVTPGRGEIPYSLPSDSPSPSPLGDETEKEWGLVDGGEIRDGPFSSFASPPRENFPPISSSSSSSSSSSCSDCARASCRPPTDSALTDFNQSAASSSGCRHNSGTSCPILLRSPSPSSPSPWVGERSRTREGRRRSRKPTREYPQLPIRLHPRNKYGVDIPTAGAHRGAHLVGRGLPHHTSPPNANAVAAAGAFLWPPAGAPAAAAAPAGALANRGRDRERQGGGERTASPHRQRERAGSPLGVGRGGPEGSSVSHPHLAVQGQGSVGAMPTPVPVQPHAEGGGVLTSSASHPGSLHPRHLGRERQSPVTVAGEQSGQEREGEWSCCHAAAKEGAMEPEEKKEKEKQQEGNLHDGSCPICLGEWEPGEQLRLLPCVHVFHQSCIDKWLRKNCVCPLCLQAVEEVPGIPVATPALSSLISRLRVAEEEQRRKLESRKRKGKRKRRAGGRCSSLPFPLSFLAFLPSASNPTVRRERRKRCMAALRGMGGAPLAAAFRGLRLVSLSLLRFGRSFAVITRRLAHRLAGMDEEAEAEEEDGENEAAVNAPLRLPPTNVNGGGEEDQQIPHAHGASASVRDREHRHSASSSSSVGREREGSQMGGAAPVPVAAEGPRRDSSALHRRRPLAQPFE